MAEKCCVSMFLWDNFLIFLLLCSGITFSALSSLDCSLLSVNIGFTPVNSELQLSPENSTSLGVGLWTFESFYKPGECFYYDVARSKDIINGDEYYNEYLFNNEDGNLSKARLLSTFGVILSLIACIIVFIYIIAFLTGCAVEPNVCIKMIVFVLALLAILCELGKLLLFTQITLCSNSIWQQDLSTNAENPMLSTAESCSIARGSWASIVSVSVYTVASIIMLADYFLQKKRPSSDHDAPYDIRRPSSAMSYAESYYNHQPPQPSSQESLYNQQNLMQPQRSMYNPQQSIIRPQYSMRPQQSMYDQQIQEMEPYNY